MYLIRYIMKGVAQLAGLFDLEINLELVMQHIEQPFCQQEKGYQVAASHEKKVSYKFYYGVLL